MQSYTFKLLFCISIFIFGFNSAFSQRIVEVTPGIGTLNEAIDSDTLANGDRVDLNTVYQLQRGPGAIYLLNSSIENRFPLTIKAVGEGARPIVKPNFDGRPMRARDDLSIEGLYITGKNTLDGVASQLIRISSDNARIEVVDCHLDSSAQQAFRFDNDSISVFVTNSIISNIAGDYNNGRGFDDRGNIVDSIVVVNTTWYNIASRIIRSDGSFSNYVRFDHNTIVNTGRRVIDPDETIEFHFTNNLVINHSILGTTTSDESGWGVISVDSLANSDIVGQTQIVDISNNNFWRDPAIDAVYEDSVVAVPLFNTTVENYIAENGTGSTNISEEIAFTNGPIGDPNMVIAFYTSGGDPASYSEQPFDTSNEPFDFAYPTGATSYTAGSGGSPLGDLNWFGLASAIEEEILIGSPTGFKLQQNYPNPFNPTTTISYSLKNATDVSLTIYNVLGKKVRTLVNQKQGAGAYSVVWNGKDEFGTNLASGIFFYTIQTDNIKQTKRMLLLK